MTVFHAMFCICNLLPAWCSWLSVSCAGWYVCCVQAAGGENPQHSPGALHPACGRPHEETAGALLHPGRQRCQVSPSLSLSSLGRAVIPKVCSECCEPSLEECLQTCARCRLAGLVVKVSASGAEGLGFESRLQQDFSRSSHNSNLKNWHSSGYPARCLAL